MISTFVVPVVVAFLFPLLSHRIAFSDFYL